MAEFTNTAALSPGSDAYQAFNGKLELMNYLYQTAGSSTHGGPSSSSGEETTRYFQGTEEASSPISNWRNRVFTNAANWLAGNQPFGYGDLVSYGTSLDDMPRIDHP